MVGDINKVSARKVFTVIEYPLFWKYHVVHLFERQQLWSRTIACVMTIPFV